MPILDFIHALTYVYSAAMVGRSCAAGVRLRPLDHLGLARRGDSRDRGLAGRLVELGSLPPAADTDPRQIVAETLTYLTNQQSRMNYPAYRLVGLPITSSYIESTVKPNSRRVKGSEKLWTESGSEALLQLRAGQLCGTAPLDNFWLRRTRQPTSIRKYTRSTQITA